jgi:Na+/phosphate symporter
MLTAVIPIVLILVGAVVYALAKHPKVSELGRLTFAAGVFGLALGYANAAIHLH